MTSRSTPFNGQTRLMLAALRALSRPACTCRWSEDGGRLLLDGGVGTDIGKAKGESRALRIPTQAVAKLLSLGLVGEGASGLAITPAGRAWLRRQLASDDPFLAQHRETHIRQLRSPSGDIEPVTVNDAESPLAWLRRRKDRDGAALIDDTQFAAGERLRRHFTFAALSARVTADWSNSASAAAGKLGSTPVGNLRDDVIAAKTRVNRALAAVGPELGRMLVDVCCLLKGIETAEATQNLPRRSGKVVLQLGLTALARHYGMTKRQGEWRGSHPEIEHWGTPDYRPVI